MDSKKIWFIGLAVIVASVFGMWIFNPNVVVVTGTGRVNVQATSATFNVSLTSVSENPNDALADLNNKVSSVKESLIGMSIDPSNITETQITLTPVAAIVSNGKGYQATVTLNVKTSNVPAVPSIIVKMYGTGATIVSQPIVTVEDQEKLEKEAFKDALSNAKQSLNDTVGLRPIRKMVGIQQASSGNVATATKVDANQGMFEVVKAVSVTYKVW